MSRIADLVVELDREINQLYEIYTAHLKELDKYRGEPVGDRVDEVNKILHDIQESFANLYKAFYFIGARHQFAVETTTRYSEFIEQLKKNGAMESPKPEVQ